MDPCFPLLSLGNERCAFWTRVARSTEDLVRVHPHGKIQTDVLDSLLLSSIQLSSAQLSLTRNSAILGSHLDRACGSMRSARTAKMHPPEKKFLLQINLRIGGDSFILGKEKLGYCTPLQDDIPPLGW